MDRDRFERIAREELEGLPHRFRKLIQNVAIMVEDEPSGRPRGGTRSPRGGTLLGIYHGVPFGHRGPYYGNTAPDVIVLYQNAIEGLGGDEEKVRERVRLVLMHEIGHYFGLSEKELREIEDSPEDRDPE